MEQKIHFEFEGKKYRVDMKAYDLSRIVLPDCTVIKVGGWGESLPPVPMMMAKDNELPFGSTPDETARLVNGIVAEAVV